MTGVLPLTPVVARPVAILPRAVRRSRAMGGELGVHVAVRDTAALARAERDAIRVGSRVTAWAGRLTRHDPSSDLMRANADPRSTLAVRPTLAVALGWAADASVLTAGIVDATLLRERLEAEAPADGLVPPTSGVPATGRTSPGVAVTPPAVPTGRPAWRLDASRHRGALLTRAPARRSTSTASPRGGSPIVPSPS